MGLAVVFTRAQVGLDAPLVRVEVNLARGVPAFAIIGMPETTVKEARDRVKTALINSGQSFPVAKITVNLSPAELPKQGARYDLAIALGILAADETLEVTELEKYECYGELALNGAVRGVAGMLPALMSCHEAQRRAIMPTDNQAEAALLRDNNGFGAATLNDVVSHLQGHQQLIRIQPAALPASPVTVGDMADVRGQEQAKRALLLAAAGNHNILFVGPPGTGKTMLAQRMIGLLPPLTEEEALEVAAIDSICGEAFNPGHWRRRPLRTPHHNMSSAALIGGGSIPKPGEASRAHRGILFLDEIAEISRHVLDSLREPLESGEVYISRAKQQARFPARFQLICALNPSPCGHFNGDLQSARATPDQIMNYLNRLSGPFLDRIDLQVEVPRQPEALKRQVPQKTASSAELRKQVIQAQKHQFKRQGCLNQALKPSDINVHCQLTDEDHAFLVEAMEKLDLSHRAYHRILRLSRTIADLEGCANVARHHMMEAMSYRALDSLLNQLKIL